MAIMEATTLSQYIVTMAQAARSAQATMSTGADPMCIKEYRFIVNLSGEMNITSVTDIGLNYMRLSLTQKVTIEYKREWGLEIECKIIPVVALET